MRGFDLHARGTCEEFFDIFPILCLRREVKRLVCSREGSCVRRQAREPRRRSVVELREFSGGEKEKNRRH